MVFYNDFRHAWYDAYRQEIVLTFIVGFRHTWSMLLKEWRLTRDKTLGEMAALLGIENARTYQRYEDGENRADAHIVERIRSVTNNDVGVIDIHAQRLEWLRANRPDLFPESTPAE